MPLETNPQSLEDLEPLYPTSGDVYTQGDDHIRSLKNVLSIQFPGLANQGFALPITATEAEINYLAGLTSNLYDQYASIDLSLSDLQSTAAAPFGTRCLFAQAAAPTGWEQVTDYHDYQLRIVNTAGGGTGGTDSPFTHDWDHVHTTAVAVLSQLHLPPHSHTLLTCSDSNGVIVNSAGKRVSVGKGSEPLTDIANIGLEGGIPFHSHGDTTGTTSDFLPKYLNTILARCITGAPPIPSSFDQQAKLVASDQAASDFFGQSASISEDGTTAIVGAYLDDSPLSDAGSAYIYINTGGVWSEQAKLVASDQAATDYFGYSVAISYDGNTAIVGAYNKDGIKGTAYVFTRSGTTWSEQAKLVASDANFSDYFGYSVGISGDGDNVIIGAIGQDLTFSTVGSAYVFTRSGTTWTEQDQLFASDRLAGDLLGSSVAMSEDGNTVIVGAYLADSPISNAGSAYIFTRSGTTWSEQAKLVASDQAAGDEFGWSVSISADGNTAIVGAYSDDISTVDEGSAYVYTRSGTTWSEQAKLVASDVANSAFFGYSVGISGSGNVVAIGAYRHSPGLPDAGQAYIFTRSGTTWSEADILQASDRAADDRFGSSICISGDATTVVVGAIYDDSPAVNAGSAYIYTAVY